MADSVSVDLRIHLAHDPDAGRWYVADSDLPGLRLEADDPATLIQRIALAAPELIELNLAELADRYGVRSQGAVRITPVFDSPLFLAA